MKGEGEKGTTPGHGLSSGIVTSDCASVGGVGCGSKAIVYTYEPAPQVMQPELPVPSTVDHGALLLTAALRHSASMKRVHHSHVAKPQRTVPKGPHPGTTTDSWNSCTTSTYIFVG